MFFVQKQKNLILRNTTPNNLKLFTWNKLIFELDTPAPTFIRVLRVMIQVRHTARPAVKSYCPSEMAILGVCAAIFLKTKMCT